MDEVPRVFRRGCRRVVLGGGEVAGVSGGVYVGGGAVGREVAWGFYEES